MSITLELTELSPELEKQLAAMSSEERGRFVAALMEKGLAGEPDAEGELDDDGAMMIGPSSNTPKIISAEAMARLQDLRHQPILEPNEHWRRAAENYKRLTGRPLGR